MLISWHFQPPVCMHEAQSSGALGKALRHIKTEHTENNDGMMRFDELDICCSLFLEHSVPVCKPRYLMTLETALS